MKPKYGPITLIKHRFQLIQGKYPKLWFTRNPNPNPVPPLPLASEVLTAQLRTTQHWTSYFVPYRSVVNDQFGWSHFNWTVDGVNYHILRIGCYPYIKYHCSRRPHQPLQLENTIFTLIKALNLGIPTLAYGIAAIFLIRYHKDVTILDTDRSIDDNGPCSSRMVRIYFLYKEDINSPN